MQYIAFIKIQNRCFWNYRWGSIKNGGSCVPLMILENVSHNFKLNALPSCIGLGILELCRINDFLENRVILNCFGFNSVSGLVFILTGLVRFNSYFHTIKYCFRWKSIYIGIYEWAFTGLLIYRKGKIFIIGITVENFFTTESNYSIFSGMGVNDGSHRNISGLGLVLDQQKDFCCVSVRLFCSVWVGRPPSRPGL